MRLIKPISIWMLAMTACAAFGQQPDPVQMAQQYSKAAEENAAMLASYSWKMRTEVNVKAGGESKQMVKLYEVRVDLDGKMQKTELTAPLASQEEPSKGRSRGLRAKVEKKRTAKKQEKIEELKEWTTSLSDLSKDYTAPSAGTMLDFYSQASYTPRPDGLVAVQGRDFLHPGDSVTFVFDPATKAPTTFSFKTTLGDDAVQGQVEYGQVPSGPRYAARTTLNVPARQLTAKLETYEYQKGL
jgi:hypothetical protein